MCVNLADASTCEYSQVLSESAKIVQKTFCFCFFKVWLLEFKFSARTLQVLASIERVFQNHSKTFFFVEIRFGYLCANLSNVSTCKYSRVLSESVKIVQKTFFFV
jgi:hypothetical protein